MSAYHAFFLRTRLVQALTRSVPSTAAVSSLPDARRGPQVTAQADQQGHLQMVSLLHKGSVDEFTRRIVRWIQWEVVIGSAILLCVALLGAFAGTLAPTPPGVAPKTGQVAGPFLQTQSVQGYSVTLKVAPDAFGTNTFTVTVADTQGRQVQGAAVLAETTMLDMDMGSDVLQLQADTSSVGTFSGQSELTMAGHWQVRLRILPPNEKTFVIVVFLFATR